MEEYEFVDSKHVLNLFSVKGKYVSDGTVIKFPRT